VLRFAPPALILSLYVKKWVELLLEIVKSVRIFLLIVG